MTTVNVVSPTGRKTSIRIQQNTTLLAIIEEACQTNSLDGRYYKLRFHGKILDDSVTFRYSGLTNNAKVDLVLQDTPRIETDIDIALQTDQGRRLRSTHKSDESLLQILRFHAIDTPPSFVPVVQYLQEEIIGQLALENRTLRGLGLTSGKALLRVTHRVVSEKQLEEINSCVIQDRARVIVLQALLPIRRALDAIEGQGGLRLSEVLVTMNISPGRNRAQRSASRSPSKSTADKKQKELTQGDKGTKSNTKSSTKSSMTPNTKSNTTPNTKSNTTPNMKSNTTPNTTPNTKSNPTPNTKSNMIPNTKSNTTPNLPPSTTPNTKAKLLAKGDQIKSLKDKPTVKKIMAIKPDKKKPPEPECASKKVK